MIYDAEKFNNDEVTLNNFFFGADLPGIGYMLNFFHWELKDAQVGTRGRAVDHVGFEVRNLKAVSYTHLTLPTIYSV